MFRKLVGLSIGIVGAVLMSLAAVTAQGPEPASPRAATGTAFTYQGALKQNGAPVNGPVNLSFRLYSVSSGGSPLGTLNQVVTPTSGVFTARLDFGNLFNGEERWLGIAIGADPELTPRQALSAVPYALYATGNWGLAGNAGTAPASNFVGTKDAQPLVFRTNNAEAMRVDGTGRIGIGTTNPSDKLTVEGGGVRLIQSPILTQGFEMPAFPPPGWTTGGIRNWTRDTSTAYEASASALVTITAFLASAYLDFDYNMPAAGTIHFFWKTSGAGPDSSLIFCLDNDGCTSAAGYTRRIVEITDWSEVIVPVASGAHSFRWVFSTGNTYFVLGDRAWLDAVYLTDAGGNLLADGNLIAKGDILASQLQVQKDGNFLGRVSIGMTTPLQLLHMNVLTGDGEGIRIDSPIAGHAPAMYLNHTGPLGRNYRIASYGDNAAQGSFRIRDDTAGADRLVIDAAGRVGINTTDPARALEVNGVIGVHDGNSRSRYGGLASEAGAALVDFGINDDSANRFGGAYVAADQGGLLRVDTRPGANLFQFLARPALSQTLVSEVFGVSSKGTVRAGLGPGQKLSLGGNGTFEIDAFGVVAGRFIVAENGRVGIGVTSPSYRLELPNSASVEGQGRANAWQTYSSRRYKTNVVTLYDALDKVLQLRGVEFDWQSNGKRDIGLIAEEVGQVFPEIVSYEPNGVDAQSLDYSRLVAALVEATKEQQRQIERQGEEMAALKGQNASLATRLEALERQATTGDVSPHASAAWADFAGMLNSGNISLVGLLGMGVYLAHRRRM